MRVMIAASVSPFCGREEMHWAQAIQGGLRENRIEVELFMLPIVHNPLLIPEQMTALRFLDVKDSSDLLITIGFPAFALKHPRKRVLLFSLASSLHEHFDTEYGILATPQYQKIREAVQNAEKKCLLEAERIVCASQTMTKQLMTDLSIKSTSLILGDSMVDEEEGHLPDNGPWIVCESMLEPAERMDLLLSAVSHSVQKWRLLICVPSASDVYRQAIDNRIERLGIKSRVEFKRRTSYRGCIEIVKCVYRAQFFFYTHTGKSNTCLEIRDSHGYSIRWWSIIGNYHTRDKRIDSRTNCR